MMDRAINKEIIMAHRASLEINRNPEKNNEFYVRVKLEGFINPPPKCDCGCRSARQ